MNTRNKYSLMALLVLACIVIPTTWAIGINWIQSYERAVGEGHPTYPDVVNRPTKQIWTIFLTEHDDTGHHNPLPYVPLDLFDVAHNPDGTLKPLTGYVSAEVFDVAHNPDGTLKPREYALQADGPMGMAQGTFPPSGLSSVSQFTLCAMALWGEHADTESLYRRTTETDAMILEFGKDGSQHLFLTLGTQTYTSTTQVFGPAVWYLPFEVGVLCDQANSRIAFFFGGQVEDWQAATFDLPTDATQETHVLGANMDGKLAWFGLSARLLFDAQTRHAPLSKGLASVFCPILYYDMSAGSGTVLADMVGLKKRLAGYPLTMTGYWSVWSDASVEAPEPGPGEN